uniref:Btz domain-containing protein n=1 Tax=Anthurium amnicola TaxID=1678845 RepID=A0A1D1YSG8_9ARAE
MSRREGRDSHGKRLHSRFDREPSPKRSRGDGKPTTERTYSSSNNLEINEHNGSDQKHSRRLQDALPPKVNPAPESKARSDFVNNELEKKAEALNDSSKHSSDPTNVPRSRSYFQHDDRGSAGQGGRSFGRRATENNVSRIGDDPKEQSSDQAKDKSAAEDLQKKEDKVSDMQRKDKNETWQDGSVWRHDKYHELEVDAPPARRRPAFRENKFSREGPAPSAKEAETVKPSRHEPPGYGSARREERGGYPRGLERTEKTFTLADDRIGREDRAPRWGEMRRASYQSRERIGFGSNSRGRDRYNGRYGERNQQPFGGLQVDKWKHDLFDEANRSPTPKNEEDEIAKVEALLAL